MASQTSAEEFCFLSQRALSLGRVHRLIRLAHSTIYRRVYSSSMIQKYAIRMHML